MPLQPAKSYERLFILLYFFFHKSWKAFISRFTACANSVKSFASFIKTSTRQSKRLTKAMTAPSKATIKQSVPPFSKNQGNSCYTIGIISSNESTTAYLTFCACLILSKMGFRVCIKFSPKIKNARLPQ